mgnify:FL=1
MTIGETIKALRTQKGMTQAELARAIGVSKYTIIRYETGASFPNFRILQRIEDEFGIRLGYNTDPATQVSSVLDGNKAQTKVLRNLDDLYPRKSMLKHWIDSLDYEAFGKAEQLLSLAGMYTTKPQEAGKEKTASLDNSRRSDFKLKIPVMGRSAAGMPIEMVSIPNEPITINGEAQVKVGDFIVIAVGDSMIEAGIHDGDKCVIRPQEQVENGEIALIAVDDGSTIKRFYQDDQGIHLKPCNPAHPTQHYDVDAPIRVLGRFITVVK